MNKHFVDFGIDLNEDNHCDLEGWFLSTNGKHRDRVFSLYDNKPENLLEFFEFIDEYFEHNAYIDCVNKITEYEKLRILIYSKNDPKNSYSCPKINKFLLRLANKNAPLLSHGELVFNEMIISYMLSAIKKFTLKKELETFKGIIITKNDPFYDFIIRAKKTIDSTGTKVEYVNERFVSTSLSKKVSIKYLATKTTGIKVLFTYVSKPGVCCMPLSISQGTCVYNEKEVLFGCFGTYKICDVKISNENKIYVKIEVDKRYLE